MFAQITLNRRSEGRREGGRGMRKEEALDKKKKENSILDLHIVITAVSLL